MGVATLEGAGPYGWAWPHLDQPILKQNLHGGRGQGGVGVFCGRVLDPAHCRSWGSLTSTEGWVWFGVGVVLGGCISSGVCGCVPWACP